MKKKIIRFFLLIIFIIILLFLYGRYIETKGLVVNETKIEVDNLDNGYHGLKVVQFSDLHYGTSIKEKEFTNIVSEINKLKPDLVFFTGDLYDESQNLSIEENDKLIKMLSNINANIGKYAISGNQDNVDKWENTIKSSGFIDLNNSQQLIYSNSTIPMLISGISSNVKSDAPIQDKINPLIENINKLNIKPCYSILLLHEPDYVDQIDTSNFNLILSGHSLGGEIRIPFIEPIFLPDGAKKYYKDYYKINNADLYVSNGLGTDKYNFRLFNKPSINFFRITKKGN